MYKSKREPAQRQSRGKTDLSQLGLFAVPNVEDMDDGDDDDPELEAELMNILHAGGGGRSPANLSASKKARGAPAANLDRMIAESLRDQPSDESSADEDDPSLLAELQVYTGESVQASAPAEQTPPAPAAAVIMNTLRERIAMYKVAEASAKSTGDTAKARRLGRGLKTLDELMKKVERGGVIDEGDIPLPVAVPQAKPPPGQPSGVESGTGVDELHQSSESSPTAEESEKAQREKEQVLSALRERRDEYKKAAVAAKKAGDLETAKAHVRLIKQFENVISGVESGEKVDLESMPPPPTPALPAAPPARPAPPPPVLEEQPPPQQDAGVSEPLSILDALEQRLAVFQKQEETAKAEGNSSKARRMGRIRKQYEDAIRLHKAGKDIPVDELPTPPGFPPIPVEKKGGTEDDSKKEQAPPSPIAPKQPSPAEKPLSSPTPSASSISPPSAKVSGRTTRQEKQLGILLKRQKEWKEAAIAAKKSGDMAKAKDCLRQAKGFDALIEASRSGLPVDLSTIPVPPKDRIDNDFEIVNITDCLPTGTNSEIFEQLKLDLKNQFKMSMETRLHYKTLGDVGNANKFEQLAVHTKKDLDRVTVLQEKNDPVPRFHYEMRSFSIVKSNTDLNDNDLELRIIQGVNYNVPNPKEIDTYVRYEFPFPSEDPKKDKTSTVYNTNNPQYETTFVIPIVRNSRACQRVFKRHALKLEVWSKGGFLRSDSLVGAVSIKLQPLETKCTIHDSFNLMDGRKPVGGKLEVMLRLRHPIQEKEVEQVKEKWLLID